MSWAEVKKINSNLDVPLDEYFKSRQLIHTTFNSSVSYTSSNDGKSISLLSVESEKPILLASFSLDSLYGLGATSGSTKLNKIDNNEFDCSVTLEIDDEVWYECGVRLTSTFPTGEMNMNLPLSGNLNIYVVPFSTKLVNVSSGPSTKIGPYVQNFGVYNTSTFEGLGYLTHLNKESNYVENNKSGNTNAFDKVLDKPLICNKLEAKFNLKKWCNITYLRNFQSIKTYPNNHISYFAEP